VNIFAHTFARDDSESNQQFRPSRQSNTYQTTECDAILSDLYAQAKARHR
jgi:hypothetical protein